MTVLAAIICQGRSGSNLLQYRLDSHPQIEMLGELFHPDRRNGFLDIAPYDDPKLDYAHQDIDSIPDYLSQRLASGKQVAGFKMPWDWLVEYPDCWGAFRDMDFRLIFLRRRNHVDRFVSVKLASLNASWSSNETYEVQRLRVDPDELLNYWVVANHVDRLLERMCARYSSISVDYETLATETETRRILDFLEVQRIPLRTLTVRSRTVPKSVVVENYDEILRLFAGHPLYHDLIGEA